MGIICSSDDACIFSLPFLVLRGVVFLWGVSFRVGLDWCILYE